MAGPILTAYPKRMTSTSHPFISPMLHDENRIQNERGDGTYWLTYTFAFNRWNKYLVNDFLITLSACNKALLLQRLVHPKSFVISECSLLPHHIPSVSTLFQPHCHHSVVPTCQYLWSFRQRSPHLLHLRSLHAWTYIPWSSSASVLHLTLTSHQSSSCFPVGLRYRWRSPHLGRPPPLFHHLPLVPPVVIPAGDRWLLRRLREETSGLNL